MFCDFQLQITTVFPDTACSTVSVLYRVSQQQLNIFANRFPPWLGPLISELARLTAHSPLETRLYRLPIAYTVPNQPMPKHKSCFASPAMLFCWITKPHPNHDAEVRVPGETRSHSLVPGWWDEGLHQSLIPRSSWGQVPWGWQYRQWDDGLSWWNKQGGVQGLIAGRLYIWSWTNDYDL